MLKQHNQLYVGSVLAKRPLPEKSYLRDLPAVNYLFARGELILNSPVTFLVGENGSGKSTLLEAIAVNFGFNPEGGTRNFNFSTYASHSELYSCIALAKYRYPKDGFYLRAESFYNMATNIDELDAEPGPGARIITRYGGVSLHKQSHGESFMAVMQNGFKGRGLYILDEPESALSPMRLMDMLVQMNDLVRNDSQFIISTHSPILMAFPGATILEMNDDGIRSVDYRQTEHYECTRRFLVDPELALQQLLSSKYKRR